MVLGRFKLTEQHVKLARRTFFAHHMFHGESADVALVDPKRPYGNSNVIGDIAVILDFCSEDAIRQGDELPSDIEAEARRIHNEMPQALEVILQSGSFEPGNYVWEIGQLWKLETTHTRPI